MLKGNCKRSFCLCMQQTTQQQLLKLTLRVLKQRGHPALDEDCLILQECAHKSPCGQLAQQVNQQLSKAFAVEQLLLVQLSLTRAARASGGTVSDRI